MSEKPFVEVELDREAAAAYVALSASRKAARTVQINGSVNVDLDQDGVLIGIEILDLPLAPAPVASTPDTELRERYARAIGWKDTTLPGLWDDRLDYYRALADAVMAERDTEIERLNGEVERLADEAANALVNQATLKGMTVEEGAAVLDLGSPRELVIAWVDAARKMLGEAPNYSETRIDFPAASMEVKAAGEVERYVFTVQRAGKVTPHQARLAAEAELAAMRAQQQDMVRLPADARGEIERLLTANAGKPAGGVAHKVMLLLTDDWWEGQDAAAERQRE